jgi:hypothetical protein
MAPGSSRKIQKASVERAFFLTTKDRTLLGGNPEKS